ncbi:putative oxidoreductase [Cardamine amara subsp. amara]|uniref:Oxidoreductase n=1 Tax=Cardamine amara subsp. amara TaxID=228776 RepID=A0ABD1C154_CARAN
MDDNKTVRFGLLGCIRFASKFVRTVTQSTNAVIIAISDPSLETAKTFAAANNLSPETVTIYGSYEELLNDASVDAVYLTMPVTQRGKWAVTAAEKKKHLLVEKPPAQDATELERIVEACESNGVQFMDGTIWLHHQRTVKIRETMFDSGLLGDVRHMYTTMTTPVPEQVLERLTKEAMGLAGAIGELGWYPIGAALWAMSYQMPISVRALPSSVATNSVGTILSCSASLQFGSTETATAIVHCSFLSQLSTDLAISGSKGSIQMNDYVIPYKEDTAWFEYTSGAKFVDMDIGWNVTPERVTVDCGGTAESQEAMMLREFVRLVQGIKRGDLEADQRWPEISRKTQLVVDAVKKSVDIGCEVVYL